MRGTPASRGQGLIGVGCDDGEVKKLGGGWTLYACIAMRGCSPDLEPIGFVAGKVRVDGLDASSVIAGGLQLLDYRADVVFLDSLTIAGFNLVSPSTLRKLYGRPVIVTYTYKPNYDRLIKAASRLPYFELRSKVLDLAGTVERLDTRRGPLYVVLEGVSGLEEALMYIECFQLHARKPEPVRAAHYIASALSKFIHANKDDSSSNY